jgi:hypothetical protein
MDDANHIPQWSVLYGGNEFILFLIIPVVVDDHPRCILISSSVIDIRSAETPLFHLLLLMILTNKFYTQTQLVKELLLEGMATGLYDASEDSEEVWIECDASYQTGNLPKEWIRQGVSAVSNSQSLIQRSSGCALRPDRLISEYAAISASPAVDVSILPYGPLHLVFSRIGSPPQPAHSLFFTHYYAGATSNVYKSNTGVILKTWIPGYADTLRQEADIYQSLSRTQARSVIPTYLGYFELGNTQILLLSDVGPALDSFEQPIHVR